MSFLEAGGASSCGLPGESLPYPGSSWEYDSTFARVGKDLELNSSVRNQGCRQPKEPVQGSLPQYWSWIPLHLDIRAHDHLPCLLWQRHEALGSPEEGSDPLLLCFPRSDRAGHHSGGSLGTLTLQWHSPLVLLQSGSKPLLTSQLHGPHVGCPHQPRGQGWSILQKDTQTGMSPHCYDISSHLVQPQVVLSASAAAQPDSRGSLRVTAEISPDPPTWSHNMAQGNLVNTRRCSRGVHWVFGYTRTGARMGSGHTRLYSCYHSNLDKKDEEGLVPTLYWQSLLSISSFLLPL